ncbi:nucleotidyl transferase AbiEii/AbiGii toxin family protein [bacterium]|nr:nucleotidyl transferase AbiEii/AbiGii toxin family protein [bacterium]
MKASRFYETVHLMLKCIELVSKESCFALKGGTAINLFVRDMPRLSVDIDLTYLPLDSRDEALSNISSALQRISQDIKKRIPGSKVLETKAKGKDQRVIKLVVSADNQLVTIEPNEVLRGAVFNPEVLYLCSKAEKNFEMTTKINTLSKNDLYGGKLCAALDRQHPRDIFDIKMLLENEGITDDIRKAFVVYLAGHDRPINELIDPPRKNIDEIYERDFVDMAEREVSLSELKAARELYINKLKNDLTDKERRFLLRLKLGTPDWDLLGIPGIDKLPSIQWKLQNIQKMKKDKHDQYVDLLRKKLAL